MAGSPKPGRLMTIPPALGQLRPVVALAIARRERLSAGGARRERDGRWSIINSKT